MQKNIHKIHALSNSFQSMQSSSLLPKQQESPLSIMIVTWNLMGTLPSSNNVKLLLNEHLTTHDLIVIGTQQCERSLFASFFCQGKQKWILTLCNVFQQSFVMISNAVLQGLHIVAFIRIEKAGFLSDIYSSKIKTGFCGCVGNKGAVQLGFNVGAKRFLFINSHLQASQKQSKRRSEDLIRIINQLVQSSLYDEAFLFGDLNYRIMMSSQEFAQYQRKNMNVLDLIHKDQLVQQQSLNYFKSTFKEGKIQFLPTYKLDPNINSYNLKRVPGWTDRIFYRSDNSSLQLKKYGSKTNILGSDHRPVFAQFITTFKNKKQGVVKLKTRTKNWC